MRRKFLYVDPPMDNVAVMILEIGPFIFRNRGPLSHFRAHLLNNNELSNAVPKCQEIGQYWPKKDLVVNIILCWTKGG